jgi:hypothetical protein
MHDQFSKFQKTPSDSNQILRVALKCNAFVLRRARELPPGQQKPMLAIVKELITMEEEQDKSTILEE